MKWLVFSYSLPSKSRSSPRVTLWRRLRRLGSIAVKTGVYLLPARDDCIEAFQWLAQEVQQAKGDALVFYVEQFDGLSDEQIIKLFREARQQDYLEIDTQAEELEHKINTQQKIEILEIKEAIAKLKKRYSEILTLDFFDCPDAQLVAARLTRIEQYLKEENSVNLVSVILTEYQHKRWVTRPRPFVDRLACIWLIRKFINPNAIIRYSLQPEADEVSFDMKNAEFGHQGNLCSFETMMFRFGLEKPGLKAIAKIVHELDLRDGKYISPEAVGVETILRGWLLAGFTDIELESLGIKLFDGLYLALAKTQEA
ncbi:hypothetical protein STA3757_13440 [Stanieria sp. NIES-3757]|nr:hypothetical protein STA3757_13440 [Stanieria sp. NIES-3757]